MSRAVFLMVVLVAAMAVAMVAAEPGRPTKKLTSGATPKPYLNANGCMVGPVCPPCPQPATLADEPKVSAAATTYAMAHGDDDETADFTVRDVLRPAFLEGVKFSDDTIRADRRIAVLKYKAMVVQKNAVLEKQLKIAPKTGKNKKACAIPKALVCRCRSELPVASEKETVQHAIGYSVAHGDGDAHYNWDLERAVRRAFMAGVAYADRERHVRKAINEVPLTKGTDAAMRKELNERIKALNSKENDAKSVNSDKDNAYGDV